MKKEIIEFLNSINEHNDYIVKRYPTVNLILDQIDILLINNASDEMILNWYKSNYSAIEIIKEYIERNSKG
ncbi:hypothetical protein [Poseidonibacter ostreae]|jgi:hypothetical protein|uniref:Uncharacterized protein n=1 Tax=Poseidonibacter ostreae TaxID=2654171 RepID=A0A6L4WQV5_9BACT|nr:hypothetical protein [Poseidonibacter ostreae]KAB7884722.1 hypothetical protein GA417_10600 [Poseidonibacter ostreae]KAB7887045.1 hypothetical protein GBG19_11325 [Poseidonibacter ostreae]KAB7892016.1 hypothetical protein GBG18_04480 [Poseidonibacter ostreae]MAC83061.1 hypothetical protein [Arcobacter sp.]|tara:strand:- start:6622 stop:6834 length:213 start_codon:yes stop_codon:yes gene_type:complete